MARNGQKKYWAFISYSSKDKKWGQWLHRRLESYSIPKEFQGAGLFDGAILGRNLRPIFRDRDELSGSSELGPKIFQALEQSRFLIVLCSRNSAKSAWVNKEIEDFKALGGEKNILALILDGQPNATSNPKLSKTEECFPPTLRYPDEPLAGDLRKEGDGKERGFLKIIAGISQVGFDDIYRRHERIQRRKRLTFSGITVTIMVALTLLSLFAFHQKRQAVENAAAELKARKASDDLVAFMIDDLYEQLRRTGRLNALTSAVEKIQEHQASNPTTAAHRLRTGRNQVNILFESGRIDQATTLAQSLLATALKNKELDPTPLHLSLADFYGWNPATLEEAIEQADLALAKSSTNPTTRLDALRFRADALRDLGQLPEAIGTYRNAIQAFPPETLPNRALIVTHDHLAEVLTMSGLTTEAETQYLAAYRLSQEALVASPEDREWQYDQAVLLSKLNEHPETSNIHPALDAQKKLTELLQLEFGNARWRLELAKAKRRLVESSNSPLSEKEKNPMLDRAIELIASLLSDNSKQPAWQLEMINLLNLKGNRTGNQSFFEDAIKLTRRNPSNIPLTELTLRTLLNRLWEPQDYSSFTILKKEFDDLWTTLPSRSQNRAQNLVLKFQTIIAELYLLPSTDSAGKELLRKQANETLKAIAPQPTPPGTVESLQELLDSASKEQ